MKKLLPILILVLSFGVLAQSGITPLLGNPSNATTEQSNENNFLVAHTGYILSYNRSRGASNWVAWHVSKEDLDKVNRADAFAPDQSLPRSWWIMPNDYRNSDFDKGHLCPADDRASSRE